MPRESRLSGRAFWGLASWALPLVVVFVVSPKLLHALGADRFGVLMIVLVTPLIAAQLDFGIASTAVRHIASASRGGVVDAGETLLSLFAAFFLLGAAYGTAFWICAGPISKVIGFQAALGAHEGRDLVRACATWFAVSLWTMLPGVTARAFQSLLLIAVLQTLGTLVLWVAAWLLIREGRSIEAVAWLGVGLGAVISATTLAFIAGHIGWKQRVRLRLGILKSEAGFSAGMFAAQAANAFSYQGDRLLVSTLGSPAVAGLYALCVNVANKTTAAVAAMSGFAFPHAAELMAANRGERIGGLLQSLDRAIAALIVPVVLPALLLAEPFLVLWIRDFATQEVVFAFRILVVAFALPAFAVPLSNVLAGVGRSDLLARFAWLTVVVLFASLWLLVPQLGLVGAALAMLCANSTTFLFSRIGRRALRLGPAAGRARFWAGILLGCLVQLAPLIWLSSNTASWAMLLGGGLFTWALFYLSRMALKILSPEERELIARAGRRLGTLSD